MSYSEMPPAHESPDCQAQEFAGDRFHRCEERTRPHRSHRCGCGRMWGGDYTPAEISRYASEVLGLEMLPWQADYAAAYLNGTITVLVSPRSTDRSATARLIAALCESAPDGGGTDER